MQQPYPYGQYVYPNGAPMPVRYMVPSGQRQASPPFANQAFNRYPTVPANTHPPQNMTQPIRYPPAYAQPVMRMPYNTPQQQPPQPYYYNPYASNQETPTASSDPKTPAPKKGAKEYKDNAFTIAPDGTQNETIKGLVSNNDINELLKHKGTKVKVSKIYRITKTKPEIKPDESSDEDLPPVPVAPSRPQTIQRPVSPSSSSSSCSHCSTCSNCSCSECRDRDRSHGYDDCPECRAERDREQARRQRRK